MSTLVTPSAKAHERVSGRWVRDIEASSGRDRVIYYLKQTLGTPIPWLFSAFACLIFLSRAGLELAAWISVALTLLYVATDRFGRTREFSFFRIGSDFFLLGYTLVCLIGALMSDSPADALSTLSQARWVILLYALTYTWELFPGLNRIFFLMTGIAVAISIYGIWQHFVGIDFVRAAFLTYAPAPGHTYFNATGLLSTPETFGTLLAMILPFAAASYLLDENREVTWTRGVSIVCVLLFGLATLWTYRPGIWMATCAGACVTMLMQGKRVFSFLMIWIVFFAVVFFAAYGSPNVMFSALQKNEEVRSEHQRAQINSQVTLWGQNTWVGVGAHVGQVPGYDPGTGNVFFQILAQSGVLGGTFYLLFILGALLSTYRIFQEVPASHYWHRVLVSGGLGSQVAFHIAGLYWSTVAESLTLYLFVLVIASLNYLNEHYQRGLVPDDESL